MSPPDDAPAPRSVSGLWAAWQKADRNVGPVDAVHAVRTALAATASLLVALAVGLPEAPWAAVTTLIVVQSNLGSALIVSLQRWVGTILGAVFGAAAASTLGAGVAVFAATVFAGGLLCAATRLGRSAFRFLGITVAIVMLVQRSEPPWTLAAHRFVEVSLGIAVGLAMTAAWPDRSTTPAVS